MLETNEKKGKQAKECAVHKMSGNMSVSYIFITQIIFKT